MLIRTIVDKTNKILVIPRVCHHLFLEKNQKKYNIIIQIINIAIRLAKNSNQLHCEISRFINSAEIHITHSGGNNADAIATQAIVSDKRVNQSDINAIAPEAKAINKSTIVGDHLDIISLVSCVNGIIKLIQ